MQAFSEQERIIREQEEKAIYPKQLARLSDCGDSCIFVPALDCEDGWLPVPAPDCEDGWLFVPAPDCRVAGLFF